MPIALLFVLAPLALGGLALSLYVIRGELAAPGIRRKAAR